MSDKSLTWAGFHPEVAENAKSIVPWPCEHFKTQLGKVTQPVVSRGPEDQLIVSGSRYGPSEGIPV